LTKNMISHLVKCNLFDLHIDIFLLIKTEFQSTDLIKHSLEKIRNQAVESQ